MDPDSEIQALFFPGGETVPVTIYVYVTTGRLQAITDVPVSDYTAMGAVEHEIRSRWTVPSADQLDRYRDEATRTDPVSLIRAMDPPALRDVIVSSHLKQLQLPPQYNDFPLVFNRQDRLSGDMLLRLKKMHAGLYDTLYSKFLFEACLVV